MLLVFPSKELSCILIFSACALTKHGKQMTLGTKRAGFHSLTRFFLIAEEGVTAQGSCKSLYHSDQGVHSIDP